jgi:hypothetical protein
MQMLFVRDLRRSELLCRFARSGQVGWSLL